MFSYPLSAHVEHHSALAYGCMGLNTGDQTESEKLARTHRIVDAALGGGIRVFDHADIYARGEAEHLFGQVLKARPELRQQITLQSKCGIRFADKHGPKRFDFSRDWIVASVENSLQRLNTDYLDILLLHRPDPLMQPEEVAAAFEQLVQQGKIRHAGVSNMQWAQMQLLQDAMDRPLVANQVELSLRHLDWLEEGVSSGNAGEPTINYATGTLEYCRKHKVQLQAWGSLAQGAYCNADANTTASKAAAKADSTINAVTRCVAGYAADYGVAPEAIVLAFLLRHPAAIQPVIGTTHLQRIAACCQATSITLERAHWYDLWVTARGRELP